MIGDELAKLVGAGNVSHDQRTLEEYSRDMSFVNPVKPECVVKPRNTDDIDKIVNLARETLTPLVPVSSGPPHFRGDTVPGTGGALVVDLSGMKKIIRIDRLNRVAMFEPGVTFGELIPAVAKEGLRLNMPLLPRKSKSVAGSLLEREPVIMPKYHWDIADPLSCVEVIFGTGDIFRTGAAAGPGTIEEQWAAGGAQKEAAGPSSASWYRVIQGAQGTMGIVTWASARCEILPRVEEPFLVGSSQLDGILELVHWLIRLRLANECFVLNNSNLAAILAKKWPDDYRDIKDTLPTWVLFFNIAGYDYLPEERVSGQIKDVADVTQRVGLEAAQAIGRVSASDLLTAVQRPSGEPYWKLRYKGACHDIFFLTIYDKLPGLIGAMYDMTNEAGYPASDIGVYLQPIVQGVNCHCEFNLFYDPKNPRESDQVGELSTSSTESLMARGAFFSRPYGESTSMIINRDVATVAALNKVKAIVDPSNIMNPGKLCF
ncbi:4-cresol dehydrogenase [hydroxylating] flavoprotein subunit [subsurface metagenome]